MCRPESVNRCRTPSALSIRTRSCAPVAVAMPFLLRLELADRNRVRDTPGGALQDGLERRCGLRGQCCAVEDDARACRRREGEREPGQLVARIQREVGCRGRAAALQREAE